MQGHVKSKFIRIDFAVVGVGSHKIGFFKTIGLANLLKNGESSFGVR
jgi:hypothetical protein